MSRRIRREAVKIKDALEKTQVLTWRKGAQIIHVGYKTLGHIDFWFEVDEDINDFESRAFRVYSTGDDVHPDATYAATSVQQDTDSLGFTKTSVWHVYEHKI